MSEIRGCRSEENAIDPTVCGILLHRKTFFPDQYQENILVGVL